MTNALSRNTPPYPLRTSKNSRSLNFFRCNSPSESGTTAASLEVEWLFAMIYYYSLNSSVGALVGTLLWDIKFTRGSINFISQNGTLYLTNEFPSIFPRCAQHCLALRKERLNTYLWDAKGLIAEMNSFHDLRSVLIAVT